MVYVTKGQAQILLNGHYTFHTDGKMIDLDAIVTALDLDCRNFWWLDYFQLDILKQPASKFHRIDKSAVFFASTDTFSPSQIPNR